MVVVRGGQGGPDQGGAEGGPCLAHVLAARASTRHSILRTNLPTPHLCHPLPPALRRRRRRPQVLRAKLLAEGQLPGLGPGLGLGLRTAELLLGPEAGGAAGAGANSRQHWQWRALEVRERSFLDNPRTAHHLRVRVRVRLRGRRRRRQQRPHDSGSSMEGGLGAACWRYRGSK